ncbi:DNA primase [Gordonia phage GordDuk1]|uniref:TOTE conflict system primase domain-containing protein n=1 Tax=Gordonia phage GordDuk1 TaxID=1622191 RepID=A0A0E3T887_9CAUD|nr:DNA primase [Gordonia phage GordDuk1]AKC03025.1 hypothetical protein GordDuk1_97 [Gordonia phage GordDuk1]
MSYPERLENALARLLIARPDAVAEQHGNGAYSPQDGMIWDRKIIRAHLEGHRTYGHYVLNGDKAKFFCFDVDFRKEISRLSENTKLKYPRKLWQESGADSAERHWLEWQLKTVARLLEYRIRKMGIKTLVSFSGSKGMHVYGFPSPGEQVNAVDLRALGHAVIDDFGYLIQADNANGVNYTGDPWDQTFMLFDFELFPKQDSAENYGNLVRMEMGINKKSGKPGFFVDLEDQDYTLSRVSDPVILLEKLLEN